MILKELSIEGYKCFRDLTVVPFHNLTVLIGENDSGKSTILKALGLLLGRTAQQDEDFFNLNGIEVNEFCLSGNFKVNPDNVPESIKFFVINDNFTLKKIFTKGQAFKTYTLKNSLADIDLENYLSLTAQPTKDLLVKYELPAHPTQETRREELKVFIENEGDNLPKTINEVELIYNTISQVLPYYQYYGSHAYGNPQALVKTTLDNIVRNQFYDEHGELRLASIRSIRNRVLQKLNSSIEKNLLVNIQKYNPKIANIQGRINLDFGQGLNFQGLELDEGQGFKLVDQKGEGSKKRLFLSILEWDKEIQITSQQNRPIIRAYDEPDSNLHYDAQRKMFYAISEVANNPKVNTQSIIATHSLTMIDRAPSNSINHIVQDAGISSINYLKTDGDADIQTFLDEVSVVGGVKNSSIFYEKCFLIVEGDSEEASIGKIYKIWFNRTLSEDGVVLINLQSNGAWFNFLKLLRKNKKASTVMLLDFDTQNPECGASVTIEKLNQIGFDADFLANHVFFAGIQEFEDLYPDHRIRETFNILYPRPTKIKWTLKDIQKLRADYPKISKGFDKETLKFIAHHHQRYKKPEFASKITDLMTEKEIKNIDVLQNLFHKIGQILN
ncbi:AAA family ATPase [Mucilaginibacter sp.]|uniref:ATP-dependent nuclease n=1 Tax=Mucilaginibacter sp. TaxID=1882438 RepID=UPI0025CD82B8|nr:AAA family ATPase [Mucilaginibacter sp.]